MLVVKTFTFNPVQENTYLLYNEQKQCCIIDPGCYFPAEKEHLRAAIVDEGLSPVLLLNTHCHLDHIFGNRFVHETWQLDLHIHEKEKPVLAFGPQSGRSWGLPFDNYEGPLIDIKEGVDIKIGEDVLEVLFTPRDIHLVQCIPLMSNVVIAFLCAVDVLFRLKYSAEPTQFGVF